MSSEATAALQAARQQALHTVDQCTDNTLADVDKILADRDNSIAAAAAEAPGVTAVEDDVHRLRDVLMCVSVAGSAEAYSHLLAERAVLLRHLVSGRLADRIATERHLVTLDARLLAYEVAASTKTS
eukprot:TRINITY_DN22717_c0_g1_i1.p1 TRINITY_DN22717_c0_g1~~TRINITY_DN22717_c0_g1_i1.p1  ORF type:complete len:127 (+),score=9.09 TRINITY_DN22717_c0_g1_i1:186-566(+)